MKICRSDDSDRKRTEEKVKKRFQNKCVSSQIHRMKKEEGATVGVCPPFCSLPFLSGPVRYKPDRQRFHGSLQILGKPPLTT